MNAPVLSAMPAAIQREHDEALQTFWNTDARKLYALQNWSIGANAGKAMPDRLEWLPDYDAPIWWCIADIDGKDIEGEGATALGALADMMRLAEKHVQNEDEMRREEA